MSVFTAIDIGSSSLKWVNVDCQPGQRPILRNWGCEPLPAGTLTGNFNKLGLQDPAAFTGALGRVTGASGAVRGEAAVTFPDQFVKLFFTEIDRLQDLTERERRYTIWRLRQNLPASIVRDCILDYQHLATVRRDSGPVFKLVVEAIREELLNDLARRVAAKHVYPAFFNANSFCAYNFFSARLEATVPPETPLCFVHIGHYSTTFSFIRNGILEYVRTLDFSWVNFIELFGSVTGVDAVEARRRLRSDPLLPATERMPTAGLKGIDVFCTVFEEWFREIEQTFTFHRSNHPYLESPHVFLAGGGAVLPNLTSFLGRLLNAPVELLDPCSELEIAAPTMPELGDRLGLAAAIGAAVTLAAPAETAIAPIAADTTVEQEAVSS